MKKVSRGVCSKFSMVVALDSQSAYPTIVAMVLLNTLTISWPPPSRSILIRAVILVGHLESLTIVPHLVQVPQAPFGSIFEQHTEQHGYSSQDRTLMMSPTTAFCVHVVSSCLVCMLHLHYLVSPSHGCQLGRCPWEYATPALLHCLLERNCILWKMQFVATSSPFNVFNLAVTSV